MSEDKAKPKFLSPLKVDPEQLTRPIASGVPSIDVKFTATAHTAGTRKRQIDYVVSRPDNQDDPLVQYALAQGSTENEGLAYMTYPISHEHPTGEYKVKATIRNCDEECERRGSFKVEKDPREA